jgi:hypothetical protein
LAEEANKKDQEEEDGAWMGQRDRFFEQGLVEGFAALDFFDLDDLESQNQNDMLVRRVAYILGPVNRVLPVDDLGGANRLLRRHVCSMDDQFFEECKRR